MFDKAKKSEAQLRIAMDKAIERLCQSYGFKEEIFDDMTSEDLVWFQQQVLDDVLGKGKKK